MSADRAGPRRRVCPCAAPIVYREPGEAPTCAKCGRIRPSPESLRSLDGQDRLGAPLADRSLEPAAPRVERDPPPMPGTAPRTVPVLGQAGSGSSLDWPFGAGRPQGGDREPPGS